MNIIRKHLSSEVSKKTGLRNEHTAKVIIDAVFSSILSHLVQGNQVEIRGFGIFKVVERKTRPALNPRTGERVRVEAHKAPVIRFSGSAKEAVRGGLWNENNPEIVVRDGE